MKWTPSGENAVRHHEFTDDHGNTLTVSFREPTDIKVVSDRYLYMKRVYRIRATLVKRVELLDTSEPYYLSHFGLYLPGDNTPITARSLVIGISEQITASVNGFLVDKPSVLQDIHKWDIATQLRDLNMAHAKAQRQKAAAENDMLLLGEQINVLLSKYPDAEAWYVYLDKRG